MTQKLTFRKRTDLDRGERDGAMRYQENPYVTGISGVGDIARATATPRYAANNVETRELIDPLANGNTDAPGNNPDVIRTTGRVDQATSETNYPGQSDLGTSERAQQKIELFMRAREGNVAQNLNSDGAGGLV